MHFIHHASIQCDTPLSELSILFRNNFLFIWTAQDTYNQHKTVVRKLGELWVCKLLESNKISALKSVTGKWPLIDLCHYSKRWIKTANYFLIKLTVGVCICWHHLTSFHKPLIAWQQCFFFSFRYLPQTTKCLNCAKTRTNSWYVRSLNQLLVFASNCAMLMYLMQQFREYL